ncbi:hypothetical protein [Microbacterium sp. NIBRBAC000506063]|uniref:hypothetical protein n=1 Tax=Microbacterium sp. NIBRBAC000506063 TaxID=2734618 RepID=UPI001CB72E19|nr:hypothetical protein [Microbacterium sp. NIBRBAC000506063]
MAPLGLVAVVLLSFIKEIPLKTTVERDIVPEGISEGQLIIEHEDEFDPAAPSDAPVRPGSSSRAEAFPPGQPSPRTRSHRSPPSA